MWLQSTKTASNRSGQVPNVRLQQLELLGQAYQLPVTAFFCASLPQFESSEATGHGVGCEPHAQRSLVFRSTHLERPRRTMRVNTLSGSLWPLSGAATAALISGEVRVPPGIRPPTIALQAASAMMRSVSQGCPVIRWRGNARPLAWTRAVAELQLVRSPDLLSAVQVLLWLVDPRRRPHPAWYHPVDTVE